MVFAVLRSLLALVAASLSFTLAACGGEAAPSGDLRSGGVAAFERELDRLAGRPVVVNQWASWCGPCRAEFPLFRDVAKDLEGDVAFLGVNSRDSTDDAVAFLRRQPTGFEHFEDRDAAIARRMKAGRSWPSTAFYNAAGELVFTHQGAYRSEEDLLEDIDRYARRG